MSDFLLKIGYQLYIKTPFGPYAFKNDLKKAVDKYTNGSHSKTKLVKCGLMNVTLIPYSLNNYGFIVWHDGHSGCLIVDPGHSPPFKLFIMENKLILKTILITHKHHDHCYGVTDLIETFPGVNVYGSVADKIKHTTHQIIQDHEKFSFSFNTSNSDSDESVIIGSMLSPGHTIGHVIYSITPDISDKVHSSGDINHAIYFSGDTIFMASIGRMFECKAEVFYQTIKQFLESLLEHNCSLDNILLFPAHEYGVENLKFLCENLNTGSGTAANKLEWCKEKRIKLEPTLPCSLTEELEYNPYFQIVLSHEKQLQNNIKSKFNVEISIPTLESMLESFSFTESARSRLEAGQHEADFHIKMFREVRKMRDSINFKD